MEAAFTSAGTGACLCTHSGVHTRCSTAHAIRPILPPERAAVRPARRRAPSTSRAGTVPPMFPTLSTSARLSETATPHRAAGSDADAVRAALEQGAADPCTIARCPPPASMHCTWNAIAPSPSGRSPSSTSAIALGSPRACSTNSQQWPVLRASRFVIEGREPPATGPSDAIALIPRERDQRRHNAGSDWCHREYGERAALAPGRVARGRTAT